MAVTVYPRLGELLRERKMSVAELARQIEARYGRSVDPKTLYRLTSTEPIQRVDIEIVATIADVLELKMEELFDILALTIDAIPPENQDALLTPAENERMGELFNLESERGLSRSERRELKALVELFAHHEHDRNIRSIAAKRGVSFKQAEADVAASLEEALEWWREHEGEIRQRIADGTPPIHNSSQTNA